MTKNKLVLGLLAGTAMSATGQTAMAQGVGDQPTNTNASEDGPTILVTARRMNETLIEVPVVVTAVSGDTLQERGVVNLDGLARVVPQLLIGPQGGSVQGGEIAIRGIMGPDSNPFADQAVSFDIDGVQIAKATVRRMTDFDIAQVEVYKGPQALFFGKNSMAGIVNIRTADPGDHFEMGAKLGYEFNAQEMRAEGYVSAPLGGGFGLRLAGQYSTMQGWLTDQTPRDSVYFNDAHNPEETAFGTRATLLYDDGGNFDARLKVNYGKVDSNGPAAAMAYTSCPLGARQFSFLPAGLGDDSQCEAGDRNVNAGYGSFLSTIEGTLMNFRPDGKNFLDQEQILSSFVMNYMLGDAITLTSATGYYDVDLSQCQNYENSFAVILPSCNILTDKEFSQELNFTTDFDGILNFTGGLYFGDTKATTGSSTFLFGGLFPLLDAAIPGYGGPTTPAQVNSYILTQKGKAYSAFLSTRIEPVESLEISAGVRYSHEKKRLSDVRGGGGIGEVFNPALFTTVLDDSTLLTVANGSLAKDRDTWKDWSPEATITYRPNRDLTLFASYKHGFLSGGFNSSSVNFSAPNLDLSYRPQTIEGFESGVKASVLNGSLLLNAAAYTYKIDDLQVVNFTNATSTIRNAAAAKVDGVEFDFTYRTPLSGLTINGAAAYNKARYSSFPGAPCYNGQSISQGCTLVGGNPTQDLAGAPLPRAPKWNLQGGFAYEASVGTSYMIGLNGGVTYSGSYLTDATNAPAGRQPSYTLVDAGIRFGAEDERWQVSLIGRNLTDEYYYVATADVPFTGTDPAMAAGLLGDRFGSVSRGREFLLQVAFKFGQ